MSGDGAQAASNGLSESEAQARLKRDGYNELPRREARSFLAVIIGVLREPMMALLLAGGLLYLVLGDMTEALILLVFASISSIVTIVQETRTEHVLEALRDLTSPRALVVRDGVRRRIPGREVVCGDVIVVEEGGRVPADGRLVQAHDLAVDESLLTGESVPVHKTASGRDEVYSGTLAVRGSGLAEVTATGVRSRIGQIGQSLNTVIPEPPRMQAETRRLVRMFGGAALVICVVTVGLYGLLRGGWLKAILNGIALGMSMLPEEFPMVLAIFTAMGAWRISRAHVLTRNAGAIETLGAATVLCTDKTGTLTENRMTVAELRLPDGKTARPGDGGEAVFAELAEYARLASTRQPFDPMEIALHALSPDDGADHRRLLRTYGVRPDLMAMSQVWEEPAGHLAVAAKGAPEAMAELCGLTAEARQRLHDQAGAMAGQGLRVLAVARADWNDEILPRSQQDFPFTLIGLVGLADPLRAGVPDAVRACDAAGIRVVMITGDYPVTAEAIARKAGLAGAAVSGAELDALDDEALCARVRTANIFARITPEQKLRIVRALKRDRAVVAMTGDGVNDAPSLKAAHIGVAMGGRGTDVAREAASLVVLDDDFTSIVTAIRLGRRIHDNLRKAMCFIVAVHMPIAAFALAPLLIGLPLLLGPVHIALLEMVIDPVCALVFENEPDERDIMNRPPNPPKAPLLPLSLLIWGAVQGLVVFLLTGAIYLFTPRGLLDEESVRTVTFLALMLNLLVLTLVNRSFSTSVVRALRRPNPMLAVVAAIILAVMAVSVAWPLTRHALGFAAPHWADLAVTLPAALLCLVVLEALKWLWVKALRR